MKRKGRIAFSWDEEARGVTEDLSVKVFSAEDSLFLNFTRAEEYLANESVQPLIKDQIAAALRRGKR